MANNRICLSCGKPYEQCGSCASNRNLPVWKNLFDTEACKDIFECVSDYEQKAITKERAKERLSNCDLSIVPKLKDKIRNTTEEILKEDTPVEDTVEPNGTVGNKVPKRKNVVDFFKKYDKLHV